MARRASIAIWIGNMTLMIRAIRVLAIPTCWEAYANHDTGRTGSCREIESLAASCHGSLQTGEIHVLVLRLQFGSCVDVGVSHSHPKAGLESRHLAYSKNRYQSLSLT